MASQSNIISSKTLAVNSIRLVRRKIGLYSYAIGLAASILAGQLIGLSATNSATYDEPIHVLSGYATVKHSHILFDPEHPPLIKAISAIPLLFTPLTYPPGAANLTEEQRSMQHDTLFEALGWGYELLYGHHNYGGRLLFLARMPMVVISLLLLLVASWWAKKRWGQSAGIAVAAALCFEPTLLAHGYLTNNDVAAALTFLLGIIAIEHWLIHKTWKSAILAGGVFGIALLTKFTLLLLFPVLAIMTGLWLLLEYKSTPRQFIWKSWLQYGQQGTAIVVIGLAIIWLAYATLYAINPDYNPWQKPHSANSWGQIITTITPPMYAKGALNMVPATETLERTGYLLGQCYFGGRWDYFPVLLVTKTPIPIMVGWALAGYFWWSRRHQASRQELLSLAAIGIGVSVSLLVSTTSSINIGFRHILPAYVLLIIFAATSVKLVDWQSAVKRRGAMQHKIIAAGFVLLGLYLAFSSSSYWPNHLAYFNELTGERGREIPRIAYDSNVDWGQSVKRLRDYLQDHRIGHIAFASFNGYHEANYYGLPYTVADPANHRQRSYIALSRSAIIHRLCRPMDGPDWSWLTGAYQPVAVIDNAINLYYIP